MENGDIYFILLESEPKPGFCFAWGRRANSTVPLVYMAYACSLSSPLLSPVPNITILPSSFSSSLPFPKRSVLSATKFRAFASASALSSCPTPDVVVTREQGKNAKLIDALMCGVVDVDLGVQVPLDIHHTFQHLFQDMRSWNPYGRTSEALFAAIESGCFSGDIFVDIAHKYVEGALVFEAKLNIHCLEVPLVKHTQGPDLNKLSSLLKDVIFDWIVITSPEAGLVFLEAWKAARCPKVRIGVVGAGTASVFHEILLSREKTLEIAFSPSKATGKVLAAELPNDGDSTCKVLYPASVKAGNEIEEGLTDRGFEVTRLNTYNTEPVQEVDHAVLKQAFSAPVLAVASPSAIRAWINLVPKSESWDKSVACIGQTTALAAKKLGLKNVYYPDNPGLDGWVESIIEALRMQEKVEKALTC